MAEYTKPPWEVRTSTDPATGRFTVQFLQVAPPHRLILECGCVDPTDEDMANIQSIIRSVNAFDDLLATCKRLLGAACFVQVLAEDPLAWDDLKAAMSSAKAAIAKAAEKR